MNKLLTHPKFVSKRLIIILFAIAAVVPFSLIAVFAAAPVDYSRDNCNIVFATGSPAADGVLKPGETFGASFSVYNGSPIVNGSSQELWPSASGPTPTEKRYKMVPSTGNNYDTTWTNGNAANVVPYTAELYGGANSSFGYLIGNVAGSDARTGLGNGTGYKAPSTPGTYAFRFQLKEAGGSWHPTVTCSVNLQVKNDETQQPPVKRTNPYVCNKPYPAVLKLGSTNTSGGRKDQCVTAVQFSFQAATKDFSTPALTGTFDAATVAATRNYEAFFGGPNPAVNGELTATDLDGIQIVFGAFRTSNTENEQPPTRNPNPYVCNKPYPTVKSGYKNKADGRKDDCVSAVQYNLQAAVPSLQVTGTTDAPTVTAIRNFQAFFKATVDGVLTPAQVEGLATVFGPYKTDGTGGGGNNGGGGGGNNSKKLDIAIAGANFGSGSSGVSSFANNAIKLILSTPPFSSYKNDIAFHIVNIGAISCAPLGSTGDGRDWACDYDQAANALAKAGVPYDKAMIVNNNGTWGGTAAGVGGKFATSNIYETIVRHELAHLLGLYDEYTYPGYTDSSLPRANCGPNTQYWTEDERRLSYAGCSASNWNRQTQTSIMFDAGTNSFNAPSVRVIEETIKSFR